MGESWRRHLVFLCANERHSDAAAAIPHSHGPHSHALEMSSSTASSDGVWPSKGRLESCCTQYTTLHIPVEGKIAS